MRPKKRSRKIGRFRRPNARGNTALHFAAVNGFAAMAELLIANRANVNARNQRGETPLLAAVKSEGHSERHKIVADLLRKHGATTIVIPQ